MQRRFVLTAAIAALGSTGFSSTAWASVPHTDWPQKPIRIVVPFSAGGSNDIMARKIADKLTTQIGQPVIVENKAGAGSTIGTQHVARSKGDGYTLLFVSGTIATTPAVQKLNYDPLTDLTPIMRVASSPFVILTREGFPAKTMQEFIAYAKQNPGKINYGTAGVGDSAHLLCEFLSQKTGIKMEPVPYQGIAPAQLDLVAGRLDMIVTTMASVKGTPAEKLPIIAVTTSTRDANLAQVPTVAEAIQQDFHVDVWWGLFAGKDTPASIQTKLSEAIKTIIQAPEFKGFIERMGASINYGSPAQMRDVMTAEIALWKATAHNAGIAPKN